MLGLIALGVSAVAGAYSAYSSRQAGKAQQAIGEYNAAVTLQSSAYNADMQLATSELNAGILEQNAAYNAGLARLEGQNTVMEGLAQALGIRAVNRDVTGMQRARRAASGVVVGTGSSLVVDVAQAGILEKRALEAERIASNRANLLEHSALLELTRGKDAAAVERWKGKTGAEITRWEGQQQANLDRMGGAAARQAGNTQAIGTLLQTAGTVAGGYASYKKAGIL